MADDKGKKADNAKNSPHKIHDHHFRKELSNQLVAVQFMKHYLPKELSSAMDFSTLKGIKESFITDELTEYISDIVTEYISDIVFSCELNGKPAQISVLIEHQSSPDKYMPVRVAHYLFNACMSQLRELSEKKKKRKNFEHDTLLTPVFAMVFYHGEPYPFSMKLADCFLDPLGIMDNPFAAPIHMVDVNKLPDEELAKHELIGITALLMKHVRRGNFDEAFLSALSLFANFPEVDVKTIETLAFNALYYGLQAGQFNNIDAVIEQTKALPGPVGETMMNGVEYLFKKGELKGRLEGKLEGEQIGLEKGKREGMLEGKLETARNLLNIGVPVEQIMQATGLTEADIHELQTKH